MAWNRKEKRANNGYKPCLVNKDSMLAKWCLCSLLQRKEGWWDAQDSPFGDQRRTGDVPCDIPDCPWWFRIGRCWKGLSFQNDKTLEFSIFFRGLWVLCDGKPLFTSFFFRMPAGKNYSDEEIRKHERTDRPMGDGAFIEVLEGITGLRLKAVKPRSTPKPMNSVWCPQNTGASVQGSPIVAFLCLGYLFNRSKLWFMKRQ